MAKSKVFFLLGAASSLVNMLVQFVVFDDHRFWVRVVGVAVFVLIAYYNKVWARSLVAGLLIVLAYFTLFSQ